jgi:hypothetical protein
MIHQARPSSAPATVRAAGVLVALEGLGGLALVVVIGLAGAGPMPSAGASLPVAAFFLLIGAAVLAVAAGLLVGRRWARTPAIVLQLLLLPVVYTLLGPNRQLLFGVLTGAVVITAFLLLIGERSRRWWTGEAADPERGSKPER